MRYKILIAFILFSPGLFAQNKLAKQLFKKYIIEFQLSEYNAKLISNEKGLADFTVIALKEN